MNIERLRKIIAYSDKNHDEIYSMIKRFCSFAGIDVYKRQRLKWLAGVIHIAQMLCVGWDLLVGKNF